MPDDEQDESSTGADTGVDEGASPVAPAPAPAVDLQAIIGAVAPMVASAVAEQLSPLIAAASNRGQVIPTEPVIEDVTDAQIEAAVAAGEPLAPLLNKRASAIAKRETAELRREVAQLRDVGLSSIASLAGDRLTSKKHFATYRREIEAGVASLPQHLRGNAEALNMVYDRVVGMHNDEIEAAAEQRGARGARENPQGPTGGSAGRIAAANANELNPDEILSEGARIAAREMGGYEKAARMMGFDSVDAWLRNHQTMTGGHDA